MLQPTAIKGIIAIYNFRASRPIGRFLGSADSLPGNPQSFHRFEGSAFWRVLAVPNASTLDQRVAFVTPFADAAVHRNYVGVAHFLQVIGCQGRAESAPAIQDHFGLRIWHARLNVPFDN